MLLGRPRRDGLVGGHSYVESSNLDAKPQNFDQIKDHFKNDNTTFKQRYWRNSQYYKNNGIVFLLIQGESIATDAWANNPGYTYITLAKLYNADVYQLEHRCFGFSRPEPDMKVSSLSTCNVDQALEDIKTFISAQNSNVYKNVKPKWITFGGSYPGFLSAAFRMKYPEYTVGAVASSAPMLWTLDFFQYAQVVQDTMFDVDVNCGNAISTAFTQMQTLSLTTTGRNQLSTYFNLSPAFNANVTQLDIDNFFANIYGYFQDVTQYTYDGRNEATRGGLDVTNLCKIMTDNTVPDYIKRVNNVVLWYNKLNKITQTTMDNSYAASIKTLANTTFDDENASQDNAASRGWMWLCCNEMGVLQTTDQGYNIFQQIVPLNYYIDMCTQMFSADINIKRIRDRNTAFYKRYGGIDHYTATNIVLPNGAYDPWHSLGLNWNNTDLHVSSILIPKAGHCSDMYPIYPGEAAGLKNARDYINKEVAYFLGVPVVPFPQ
ncbi:unnamed protein product [Auanema sp. JU1783]|nr:unnamed protein product [Auanema sp. JU1783]